MSGQTTYLVDPENLKKDPRTFTFDYSYWSHDGYVEEDGGYLAPDGPKSLYTDQVCEIHSVPLFFGILILRITKKEWLIQRNFQFPKIFRIQNN